ncbi:MAG TPA: hypothetical protein PLF81_25970, partial [Candidatus Anammoximicrobium sp.]|nr:hypothetical protein [Candidatus Anammoximicrobium sp.]
QFYAPATNPYASAFLDQQQALGLISPTARANTQGLSALTYRAFAHGGNPFLGEGNGFGVPSKVDNQIWRVSGGLKGTLGDWAARSATSAMTSTSRTTSRLATSPSPTSSVSACRTPFPASAARTAL